MGHENGNFKAILSHLLPLLTKAIIFSFPNERSILPTKHNLGFRITNHNYKVELEEAGIIQAILDAQHIPKIQPVCCLRSVLEWKDNHAWKGNARYGSPSKSSLVNSLIICFNSNYPQINVSFNKALTTDFVSCLFLL